jgi:hypothetical protein
MTDFKRQVLLAIPDSTDSQFLFLPTADGKWTLPKYDVESYVVMDLHLRQRKIQEDFQSEMTVLRWFGRRIEEGSEFNRLWIFALMENHNSYWSIPDGAKFFDASAIESLPLEDEWQRASILEALRTIKEEAPALRPPWFRKGWYARAKQWLEEALQNHGYQATAIEQYKHWSLSALIRAETNQGLVFFKIANNFPLFAHEPKIMEKLSELFPKFVPPPLASNHPERWMLMADFGTMVWQTQQSPELLLRLARDCARLQQETQSPEMHRVLEEAGCFNRRLKVLEAQIEPMFSNEASYADLTEEELGIWKALKPQCIALCQTLAQYNIPDTLVHGDFHGGNIAIRGEDLLIFDWTDACISHPFFDLPVFIDNAEGVDKDELRKAYLSEWLSYEPMERLEEAYRLAEVGAMLHQLVSYQGIHDGVEAEEQYNWKQSVNYYIRSILKALPALNL